MTLSLEGIRPAVIDKSTATQLDELRAFRHVFRNMYRKQIDARRIIDLQSSLPETVSNFRRHIHSFIELLQNSTS